MRNYDNDPPMETLDEPPKDCTTCGCLECKCYDPIEEQDQAELKQWVEDITADW